MVTSPMTTAQESSNGHRLSPPCSFPESQEQNQSKNPTDNNSNSIAANDQVAERQKGVPISLLLAQEKVPAGAYHVPPELYAPKADSFDDTVPDGLRTMKM